jgi:hypothetical protein
MAVALNKPQRDTGTTDRQVDNRCARSGPRVPVPTARAPHPLVASERLSALRRSTFDLAVKCSGGPFSVVLYALTTSGKEPTATLERVRAYATAQGWRVADVAFDDCGMTEPNERAGWTKALGLLRSAHAQGVVTVDRSAVSTNDAEYEQVLRWLQDRRSFLEHVPLGWRPIHRI